MEQSRTPSPLNGSVLVLNRFYMAVHVVSVRRSLALLYRELAEVIHVENNQYCNYDFDAWLELGEFISADSDNEQNEQSEEMDWVRSVNFSIQVPRVVRLNFYDKVPQLTLRFNRRNLFARDQNQCQYCGKAFPLSKLSFDHVVPRSHGGQTSWENVVCCCLKCNTRKGDRTPEQSHMPLIKKPVRPRQHPLLSVKMDNPKYAIWRTFLSSCSPVR